MIDYNNYKVDLFRYYKIINDYINDFIKPKVTGSYMDFGNNLGWLNNTAIDQQREYTNTSSLFDNQNANGLNSNISNSNMFEPLKDDHLETIVLSCILMKYVNWKKVLDEAIRISDKVIGINAMPASDEWGVIGGNVKSVIYQEEMMDYIGKYKNLKITFEEMKFDMYYFEIFKDLNIKK